MTRIRIKICGFTREQDAIAAAEAGTDAIGLNFYPHSSRLVDTATAARIVAALPPFVTIVGLFLDAESAQVENILNHVPLDLLQFHGAESPAYCCAFGKPFIKAVPMRFGADVVAYARDFDAAKGLLLDSHGGDKIGGSGERFDWNLIPKLDMPVILAGGLDPSNVAAAIEQVQPYAVDVSSGVEVAKGIKDAALMRMFIKNVEGANQDASRD